MRWLAGAAAAFMVACLTGCDTDAGGAAASRPVTPVIARGAPAAPSVAASGCSTWVTAPGTPYAVVHISTTLHVRHASAPQAGARGLVAVSSIDVAFVSGGAQVGWATQAPPQDDAAMVIGNGKRELTAVAYSIYLSGRWAPDCQVLRIYWLP
jgi:hypothetical protein